MRCGHYDRCQSRDAGKVLLGRGKKISGKEGDLWEKRGEGAAINFGAENFAPRWLPASFFFWKNGQRLRLILGHKSWAPPRLEIEASPATKDLGN